MMCKFAILLLLIFMKGLLNATSWRTILAGFIVGYVSAWGMHWATTLYTAAGNPVHERIPVLTP